MDREERFMREINFEHYKIFYYVAKFQNITMAANYLFLSQPSISRCVKNLEDEFRANKALQKKVAETDNIVPVMSAVIKEVTGGENAEGITYTQNNEEKNIAVDGVFCAIGSVPNTQALEGVCELDESGYVKAGEDGITTAKGLFVAGDVRTTPLRQVITAAADGANALSSAEKYIMEL